MKLPKIFRKKRERKELFLIKQFEEGKILQIDVDIDNKKFMNKK